MPAFGVLFQDLSGLPNPLDPAKLDELREAETTMEELLELRPTIVERTELFKIFLQKLEAIEAPLYLWVEMADLKTDRGNAVDRVAMNRIKAVPASRGEIESGIGHRSPEDPIRKALERRLKDQAFDD